MKRQFIPDDEIILNDETDTLKTLGYAESLEKVIKNAPKNKVFTIGLFGNWGTGKSSIIKTVQNNFETENKKVKFIKYDAWKYANDSFRRMFLLKVQEELRHPQTAEMNRFYQSETIEAEPKTYINKPRLYLAFGILLILLFAIWCSNFTPENKVTLSSITTIIGLIIAVFNEIFQKLTIQINKPMTFAPEQFEDCFKEIISKSLSTSKWHKKTLEFVTCNDKSITNLEQIIIVIDNIDRCHHTLAYQLLTDIKTFLCDERYNVIFIIPVDDDALKKNLFSQDRNEAECNKDKEEFLRKFFNVTLRIKPHQPTEMHYFARELNTKYNLGFYDDTIALATKEFATNPRRIIQLFNNLSSELCLYDIEFAKTHQATICAILILREEYNEFYKTVLKNPHILRTPSEYDKDVEPFMRSADIYFRTCNINDISHILTNSDAQFGDIESGIIEGVRTYDSNSVIEYAKTNDDKNDILIDLIIKHIEDDINSRSILLMCNRLAFISKCFVVMPLSAATANRINSTFKGIYKDLIPNIGEQDIKEICLFANILEEHKHPLLKKSIIKHIENNNENHTFFRIALSIFQNREDSKALSQLTTNTFIDNDIFDEISYSEDQLNHLFSEALFNKLLEGVQLDESNVQYRNLLWIFRHKRNITVEMYDRFFSTIGSLTQNKKKEDTLQFVVLLMPYFKEIENKALKGTDGIHVIYKNIYEQRRVNNTIYKILSEYQNNPEATSTLVNGCYEIYRIADGILSNDIISTCYNNAKDISQKRILELSDNELSIIPFNNVILSETDYNNEQSIELIKRCLLNRINGTWAIEESVANSKIKTLLDKITEARVPKLILSLSEDDLCKKTIIHNIKGRSADYVNSLPEELFELAISAFSNENKEEFANNFEYLGIIASKGSEEQKTSVASLCTNNLNNNEKIPETLCILEKLELQTEASIKMISGTLETFKSTYPTVHKEIIGRLVEKFK